MTSVRVNVYLEGMTETLRAVDGIKNGKRDALMGGINDTLRSGRAYISRLIRDKVNIKKRDIDGYIAVDWANKAKASRGKQSGNLFLREGKRMPLKLFGAKEMRRGGVSYRIDKGSGKKLLKTAFIVERFGHNVFTRKGKNRFPLAKHHGVSAWGAFVKNDYLPKTQTVMGERLHRNIERRVNMLLLRAAGKI